MKIEKEIEEYKKNNNNNQNQNFSQDYEDLLRKEEKRIRELISHETQLKLLIEGIVIENENLENKNQKLNKEIVKY